MFAKCENDENFLALFNCIEYNIRLCGNASKPFNLQLLIFQASAIRDQGNYQRCKPAGRRARLGHMEILGMAGFIRPLLFEVAIVMLHKVLNEAAWQSSCEASIAA